MGGSAVSCLKIVVCGCDTVNKQHKKEAHEVPSDKRGGWSFRKRSASDRVLSNTIPLETESSSNKEIHDTVNLDFKTQSDPIVPDNISSISWIDEKPALSAPLKLQESAIEKDKGLDIDNLDEAVVVSIQAAIRAFLVQKELVKLRNLVKLQAMVRGHLVRRDAVGTLRCIKAIIKIQSLVRAHQACHPSKKNRDSSILAVNGNMEKRSNNICGNKFACKLLESTPRTKRIYLKCDTSKSDSTWRWLERWMYVLSIGVEPDSVILLKKEDEYEQSISLMNPGSIHQDSSLVDSKLVKGEPTKDLNHPVIDSNVTESEEKLIKYDANDFDVLACKPTSSDDDRLVKDADFIQIQLEQPDPSSQLELNSVPEKSDLDSFSQLENSESEHQVDDTKVASGSRKMINPAFITAQTNSIRFVENSYSHAPTNQPDGSECGTELSITSTLDSPIRPGFGPTEIIVKEEIKILDENDPVSESNHLIDSKNETKASSHVELELRSDMGHQMCKSEVEASPRSLVTVPESIETPSSQVSVSSKKGRSDKNIPDLKRRSLSSGKRSTMNSNHDSGSKGSSERKNGKGHNSSSELSKTEVSVDQEPRDSSSSNSLPSYMQATESARAKALANSSPRSSPNAQDTTIKKRHSLPTANGRFGSPTIQRSTSQTQQQQPSKGNERKWQR